MFCVVDWGSSLRHWSGLRNLFSWKTLLRLHNGSETSDLVQICRQALLWEDFSDLINLLPRSEKLRRHFRSTLWHADGLVFFVSVWSPRMRCLPSKSERDACGKVTPSTVVYFKKFCPTSFFLKKIPQSSFMTIHNTFHVKSKLSTTKP